MEYLIAAAIGIYILYVIIKYISSYPERKRLRKLAEAKIAEDAMIQEILNGFDVHAERQSIINLLEESLPEGYRCGRRGCDGILLKQTTNLGGRYYVCSKCNNTVWTIRKSRLSK